MRAERWATCVCSLRLGLRRPIYAGLPLSGKRGRSRRSRSALRTASRRGRSHCSMMAMGAIRGYGDGRRIPGVGGDGGGLPPAGACVRARSLRRSLNWGGLRLAASSTAHPCIGATQRAVAPATGVGQRCAGAGRCGRSRPHSGDVAAALRAPTGALGGWIGSLAGRGATMATLWRANSGVWGRLGNSRNSRNSYS